jgi:hypothetical protein
MIQNAPLHSTPHQPIRGPDPIPSPNRHQSHRAPLHPHLRLRLRRRGQRLEQLGAERGECPQAGRVLGGLAGGEAAVHLDEDGVGAWFVGG